MEQSVSTVVTTTVLLMISLFEYTRVFVLLAMSAPDEFFQVTAGVGIPVAAHTSLAVIPAGTIALDGG